MRPERANVPASVEFPTHTVSNRQKQRSIPCHDRKSNPLHSPCYSRSLMLPFSWECAALPFTTSCTTKDSPRSLWEDNAAFILNRSTTGLSRTNGSHKLYECDLVITRSR